MPRVFTSSHCDMSVQCFEITRAMPGHARACRRLCMHAHIERHTVWHVIVRADLTVSGSHDSDLWPTGMQTMLQNKPSFTVTNNHWVMIISKCQHWWLVRHLWWQQSAADEEACLREAQCQRTTVSFCKLKQCCNCYVWSWSDGVCHYKCNAKVVIEGTVN